jgi:hypothetical protein
MWYDVNFSDKQTGMQPLYTAISIKVVPEQNGKVEYERERLLGIAKKLINCLAIPSSLSCSYSTFPLCSGTTLIEIAVYLHCIQYLWLRS